MINLDYTGPLEAIRAKIEEYAPGVKAFVGVLPTGAGVSLVVTGGAVKHDYAGNISVPLQFAVNAKAKGAEAAADLLAQAHAAINRLTLSGDGWQMTGVSVQRAPAQVGMDPQGWTLLTSSATARLIYWEEADA